MGDRLKGKVAIVTGSGRGIGRAEALALSAEGAKVVVNDLGVGIDGSGSSPKFADEVVAEIKKTGGMAVPNYDSVATMQGAENIINTALDKFGRLDILVNNAGAISETNFVWDLSEKSWDIPTIVRLKGTFACTKYACHWFRQQKSGRIINTATHSGLGTKWRLAQSSAGGEGIVGFTRTVAREIGPYGVTCNAIRPRVFTRLWAQMVMGLDSESAMIEALEREERLEELKQYKKLTPDTLASFVVFLTTPEAANINGKVFTVNPDYIGIYQDPEPEKIIYKDGSWTLDELLEIVPRTLSVGLVNKWAQAPDKEN